MTGVTVEGNGGYGVRVQSRGVAQLEACAVEGCGNASGDYSTDHDVRIVEGAYRNGYGGRIEGVDPSLVKELR